VIDFTALIRGGLAANRRDPDLKLHPSTHLDGNLRHAWLDVHGFKRQVNEFANDARLQSGTWWHEYIQGLLYGQPAMHEVDLTPWLPRGWSGRADTLLYDPFTLSWHLFDYKTTDNVAKVADWGIKGTHAVQTASYAYGFTNMGLNVHHEAQVVYIPISGVGEPLVCTVDVSQESMRQAAITMNEVRDAVAQHTSQPDWPEDLLHYRRTLGGVTLHWQHHMSRGFCPFPLDVCGCKVDDLKWHKMGTFKWHNNWGVKELMYFDNMTGEPADPPPDADLLKVEEMLR
jgi:hypothetical protein